MTSERFAPGASSAEPSPAQYLPGEHGTQSSADVRPACAGPIEPAGHAAGAAARAGQKYVGGHTVICVALFVQ
jgi:hypothetical protein